MLLPFVLQPPGERNERVEQLEEDIEDMRRIFHEQLEVCVDQLQRARQETPKKEAVQ